MISRQINRGLIPDSEALGLRLELGLEIQD
jgi:hypothetical protein